MCFCSLDDAQQHPHTKQNHLPQKNFMFGEFVHKIHIIFMDDFFSTRINYLLLFHTLQLNLLIMVTF